ncbi:MAG TPA: hypothetical protein VF191_00970 [Cyclobacteriaceae bacterium]
MQLKSFLIGFLGLAVAAGASAQVEYDDLYFNSADRQEMNTLKGTQSVAMTGKRKKALTEEFSNPTDSYSARNINPEHISRSNADEARADEQDYFITNYNQKSAAGYSAWNNDFNRWYNSPWYSTGWYGSSFGYPYSPYYSHMYSPYWGSPWYDPFYYDPFYMGYGPSWSFGYGFSMGSFYRPWYLGLSAGYGWYNSWYPTRVIVVDNGVNSKVQYGKRPTRGYTSYNNSAVTNTRSRNSVSTPPSYTRPSTSGRTTSTVNTSNSSQQSSYYNKNWRSASQTAPSRSGSSWSSGSNSRSTYNSGSYDRGSRGSSYSPAPQRSYSGSSYSGGSSSSGSSGGGSNGRTRGGR